MGEGKRKDGGGTRLTGEGWTGRGGNEERGGGEGWATNAKERVAKKGVAFGGTSVARGGAVDGPSHPILSGKPMTESSSAGEYRFVEAVCVCVRDCMWVGMCILCVFGISEQIDLQSR